MVILLSASTIDGPLNSRGGQELKFFITAPSHLFMSSSRAEKIGSLVIHDSSTVTFSEWVLKNRGSVRSEGSHFSIFAEPSTTRLGVEINTAPLRSAPGATVRDCVPVDSEDVLVLL